MPYLRLILAIVSSPRIPSSTILIFSSVLYVLLVFLLIYCLRPLGLLPRLRPSLLFVSIFLVIINKVKLKKMSNNYYPKMVRFCLMLNTTSKNNNAKTNLFIGGVAVVLGVTAYILYQKNIELNKQLIQVNKRQINR
jgi:hypothetical protein